MRNESPASSRRDQTPSRGRPDLIDLILLSCFLVLLAGCGAPGRGGEAPTVTPLPSPTTASGSPPPATPRATTVVPTPTTRPMPTTAPMPATPPTLSPTRTTVPPVLQLAPEFTGLDRPLFLTHAGDGTGTVYIVEKRGRIRVAKDGVVRSQPFLDISPVVRSTGSEQGLLGLAFHPRYTSNGYLYVNYTDANGDTVIARYTAPGDRSTADLASAKTILAVDQPFANHNGGMLAFGPDGMLWIGLGDGGSGGDPRDNGQNLGELLGKLLRIDVDRGDPYAIPADNPFIGQSVVRGEIWASGLRNPWRFSFDRLTGDLYLGDVGQGAWEEVDFIPAGTPGGLNFGWRRMEGSHCYSSRTGCNRTGLTLPILEYPNPQEGCSVIGGYVYRGKAVPEAAGTYYFTDYCTSTLWAASRDEAGTWTRTVAVRRASGATGHSSMGEDEAGELYVTDLDDGIVYRLTATRP